jgi:hypothetical protein
MSRTISRDVKVAVSAAPPGLVGFWALSPGLTPGPMGMSPLRGLRGTLSLQSFAVLAVLAVPALDPTLIDDRRPLR